MRAGTALVTGGAGYIGSNVALTLAAAGWRVVVVDNLSTGRRGLVPHEAAFVEGDIADLSLLRSTMARHRVNAVLHFSGSIVVPESMVDPLLYYANNLAASLSLLKVCVETGIKALVFSSTAAVYGEPESVPISEAAPTRPLNPYGRSKLMTEQMLADIGRAHGLPYVALRYFNVAGADPAGRSGQATTVATHLIKVACEVAAGKRPQMEIFGTDYGTPDGTAIRDYIHVTDLADAHLHALTHLVEGGKSLTLNCGYGRGFSVREVLRTVERLAGQPIRAVESPRRAGDPAVLIADPTALKTRLGWRPRYDSLEQIVATALAWERSPSNAMAASA
jgi:UDP-glucose 4-epimerase